MLRPLAHRNYRLWAAADVVSVAGTWMQVLGLNWLVLSVTGSATAMGFSVLLQALPVLLLGGWGGALADRLPARPVLVTCQVLRAALSVGLAAAVLGGGRSMWLVYAVTLLTGAITAVEAPTLGRFGSTLVGRETLGSAVALGSVLSSAGRILGMALGGLVAGVAGPAPLFLINAVSFIAVIAALSAIRAGELHPIAAAAPGTADGGVRAGLRYLLGQPVILVVLGLSFLLGGLGRNYQLTMAAMAAGPLDAGAAGYGVLSTVFAVGGVLGALVAAARGRLGLRLLLAAGAAISALQLIAGLAPDLVWFAAAILPIAAGAVIVDTVVSTRLQLDTREDMRGRMIAALGLVSSCAAMVGAPVLGWLSDAVGPRGCLVVAGALTTLGSLAAAVLLYRLRGRRADARLQARSGSGAAGGPGPTALAGTAPGAPWPDAARPATRPDRPGSGEQQPHRHGDERVGGQQRRGAAQPRRRLRRFQQAAHPGVQVGGGAQRARRGRRAGNGGEAQQRPDERSVRVLAAGLVVGPHLDQQRHRRARPAHPARPGQRPAQRGERQ